MQVTDAQYRYHVKLLQIKIVALINNDSMIYSWPHIGIKQWNSIDKICQIILFFLPLSSKSRDLPHLSNGRYKY